MTGAKRTLTIARLAQVSIAVLLVTTLLGIAAGVVAVSKVSALNSAWRSPAEPFGSREVINLCYGYVNATNRCRSPPAHL